MSVDGICALVLIALMIGLGLYGWLTSGHKHVWKTLRVQAQMFHNSAYRTHATQKCEECGKTRSKGYGGNLTAEEIDT